MHFLFEEHSIKGALQKHPLTHSCEHTPGPFLKFLQSKGHDEPQSFHVELLELHGTSETNLKLQIISTVDVSTKTM